MQEIIQKIKDIMNFDFNIEAPYIEHLKNNSEGICAFMHYSFCHFTVMNNNEIRISFNMDYINPFLTFNIAKEFANNELNIEIYESYIERNNQIIFESELNEIAKIEKLKAEKEAGLKMHVQPLIV